MIVIIVPFFITDAKKQTQMAALSKERDNLQSAIKTYKSLFETTEQLIEELKSKSIIIICYNIFYCCVLFNLRKRMLHINFKYMD